MNPGQEFDLSELLGAMQQLKSDMESAQQAIADSVCEVSTPDGQVRAVVSGEGELTEIRISPDAMSSLDPTTAARELEGMVLTAVRGAFHAAADLRRQRIEPLTGLLSSASGRIPAIFLP